MKITGLDGIFDGGNKPKVSAADLVKGREISEVSFEIDDYGAGLDLILSDGEVIKIRVSCMPSADTAFYIYL